MDVILLFNGLGNQMSQYAFYLKKKKASASAKFIFEKRSRAVHNGYELDKVFGIKEETTGIDKILYLIYLGLGYQKLRFVSQPIIRLFGLLGFAVRKENDIYGFQPAMMPSSSGINFYVGGWHSEKYFQDIKHSVLHAFRFDTTKMGTANLEVLEKISTCTSVSVHVRRGDFMDADNYRKFGSICTLNYFLCAIQKMRTLAKDPHFFFFTNDHAWVREHFTGSDFTIININAGSDSWKDMFLMSNCVHNISSNGSFSWWSSYLNKHENKIVIVPKYFIADTYYEDIYPEDWIQLSDY
jgi:hypothetical protein